MFSRKNATIDTERIVAGLDIGTTKVCMVVGKLNQHGLMDVLGLGVATSEGVKRGQVDNLDRTIEAIKQARDIAEAQSNCTINEVIVGISGEHVRTFHKKSIITLNNPNGEIGEDDLRRLREETNRIPVEPGHQILHIIPQDYTVDNTTGILDPIGRSGVRLEGNYLIVTGDSTAIRNIQRCVERSGLYLAEMVLQPVASSHAVLSDEEKEAGVALLDIGGGTSDLIVYQDNILRHTAVVPFGGNVITEDVKQGCMVLRTHAETLKIKHGSAMADALGDEELLTMTGLKDRPNKEIRRSTLANIIQARMEEILEMMYYELRNAGLVRHLGAGIVITGGGSEVQHLKELCEYVTGVETRIAQPGEVLHKGMAMEVNKPKYATAVGLTLHGLYDFGNTIRAKQNFGTTTAVHTRTAAPQPQETVPVNGNPVSADGKNPNGLTNRLATWLKSTIQNVEDAIE